MSQENVQLVRRCFDLVDRRGLEAVDGIVDEFCDPEVEVRRLASDPTTGLRSSRGLRHLTRAPLTVARFTDRRCRISDSGKREWLG
jgi:ketosteroid isomerase-like protein